MELTRTPLILAEVATLFEAGRPIPGTKYGVLEQILRLVEESGAHRDQLQLPPVLGLGAEYLHHLAMRMTAGAATVISEGDARVTVATIGATLRDAGQIAARPEPPSVLNSLVAHHVKPA